MKFNQKTVTVVTDQGRRWNVPPLKEAERTMNVIGIKKKKFEPV